MAKPAAALEPAQVISEGFEPVHRRVAADFRAAVEAAFPELFADSATAPSVQVARAQPQFGDYQCNSAMGFFRQFGARYPALTSPRAFGERIAAALAAVHYSAISVAPAGYVTVALKTEWLVALIQEQLLRPAEIRCRVAAPQRVGVDYSSPNIAKEMHVGHLRSTIHGESLARVLAFVGHDVARVNHVGDWGTQFGMLIEYMYEVYPDFLAAPPALGDLNAFYKAAKVRFDDDAAFKTRARQRVVRLQSGDEAARAAWQMLVKISLAEFDKVYARLGITQLQMKGESFYNAMLPAVVRQCEAAGLVEVVEGGAKCVFDAAVGTKQRANEVPLMLVKSDGGYGYDSTDAACVYHRLVEERFDRFIYVTDSGQEEHFLKIFRLAQRMSWHKPPATRLDHCGLGLVCGDDGKKFKTRSGEVVKLADLLDEAVRRAEDELRSRQTLRDDELHKAAQQIGYAAVKYFDMNQMRTGNYKFNYDKMLDPKGNTAVYLFYAYARVCSIFRKTAIAESELTELIITEDAERALILQLTKLPEVIETVLDEMSMHRICDFAYQTCVTFSEFYQQCRVVGSEQEKARLALCLAVKRALKLSFHLLGMEPLETI